MYYSIKKNKILRNRLNQTGERLSQWKLYTLIGKKDIKEDINGKTSRVCGLEDVILSLSKIIYGLNIIPIKIPMAVFA